MIGHQNEGMHVATASGPRFPKAFQEMKAIFAREENWLSVVASHDEVLGQSWEIGSRPPGHLSTTARENNGATKKNGPPKRRAVLIDLSPLT